MFADEFLHTLPCFGRTRLVVRVFLHVEVLKECPIFGVGTYVIELDYSNVLLAKENGSINIL